jgi:malate/lactate dehydrogenase
VVGAGAVGATCAQVLAARDYADVVLVDIKEGLPQGKALDINQMGAVLGYEPNVVGSNDYEESAESDVVVITAGVPRTGDMSRDDLVSINEKIVVQVVEAAAVQSPEAILIVVSNPLDAMCHVAKSVSGWPKERVFGMAGILDTARFSTFIAWETGASVKDVTAMVLGGHGDQMVPVVSATTVGGVPLRKLARRGRDPGDGRANGQGRRRAREAARHLGLVRARSGGGADGRRDHARREADAAVHGVSRGRIRNRRASTWACPSSSAAAASKRWSSSSSPRTSRRC